jgi:hypothetical protein
MRFLSLVFLTKSTHLVPWSTLHYFLNTILLEDLNFKLILDTIGIRGNEYFCPARVKE